MGRAPCCDKANVKKGPWSPEEDATLKAYIEQNGTGGNWIALPQKIGLKRCGKSCRLRWLNYLRPHIKHGGFSEEEDNIICSLYLTIGSRWSIIAAQLPGRTDNDIKNYWNTRLKKKLLGKQRKEQQSRRACIRQEIKRESQSFVVHPSVINQQASYWPELPSSSPATVMPVMINNPISLSQHQDSHFWDQESLRSLLMKLGGRFSDDNSSSSNNNNNQESSNMSSTIYSVDGSCITQDQQYPSSMNMISSSSMNSTDSPSSQLPNSNYTINEAAQPAGGTSMFQGLIDGFPNELDYELLSYSSNNNHHHQQQQHQIQGQMENFYAMENMGNSNNIGSRNNGASSGESGSCWGNNVSPFQAYPHLVTDFETCCLQSLPQDHHSSLEVSSYFVSQ